MRTNEVIGEKKQNGNLVKIPVKNIVVQLFLGPKILKDMNLFLQLMCSMKILAMARPLFLHLMQSSRKAMKNLRIVLWVFLPRGFFLIVVSANSLMELGIYKAWGTWYIDQQPMVVHAWGAKVGSVLSIPLWVKLTEEGLSSLASAIGPPLGTDALTSQLEVLPFAKLCVNYKVGEDLPTKLQVVDLDPVTGEKSIVEVLMSYPNRPLVCTACRSLGHLVGACPKVTRKWVRKEKPVMPQTDIPYPTPIVEPAHTNTEHPAVPEPMATDENMATEVHVDHVDTDDEWHTVSKKRVSLLLLLWKTLLVL
ncbi:hypothetical protein POM88_032880 [Heracleum sosnowskyi]|uniref:DUF4283 domain-containing protein n=1 Tax=Heracleum sosnowskyi TaxID=360622 RepID=A0AAD8I057_9APIA|nr:hypothetical protein POM88_032880 [Heracleum sosnowskyi]